MPSYYRTDWKRRENVFFRNIIVLLSFMFSINGQKVETCIKTTCFCFADVGELEYQCPNSEAKNKVVIHQGASHSIRVECWNNNTPDVLPHNISFSGTDITISECTVTSQIISVFNLDKVEKLKVENSDMSHSIAAFFTKSVNRLTKLSLKALNFYSEFDGIVAPNLTSLDLEEIELNIGVKIFRNSPKLLKLHLGFNKIFVLEDNIFENLTNLEILMLSQNNIAFLGNEVFRNLYALRNLQLDFNDIELISDETFRNLKNLNLLDISNNNIQNIRKEVLTPLKSIKYIYMDYNVGILLDDHLFANFTELTAVFLGNSDIKYLPQNLFIGSVKINVLSLENNQISFIPNGLFKGLKNLRVLNLNNNRLAKLNHGIFDTLGKLKTLNLYDNEITGIDSDVLKSLTVLEELNLNNNEISYINNDSFKNNQHLQKIHLSNNRYSYQIHPKSYFPRSPFSTCPNLEQVDLSNNLVKDIPDDLFIHARYLKKLNLKGNMIEAVDISSLWKLSRRGVVLNLERNLITHFFIDTAPLQEEDYSSNESTNVDDDDESIVLISNNPINCDCYAGKFLDLITHKVTPFTNLGIIFKYDELVCNAPTSLKKTKFSEISPMDLVCPFDEIVNISTCTNPKQCHCYWRPHDKTIIVDCINKNLTTVPKILIDIDLDYNETEVHLEGNNLMMGPNEEDGFSNVTKLYLSNNRLNQLLWIPPKIKILDLTNNSLQYLNQNILESLHVSVFENLTLRNNPWTCTCKALNMTKFLRRNVEKVDSQSIKCHKTETLLIDLTLPDICEDNILIYTSLIIVFCTMLSILLLGLVIYYKYRQEIKIWLYARNFCLKCLAENELGKHKKYDVFISYSHKDEDFVVDHLVPELEKGPRSYKLCLHYRDWIPGDLITDNITHSVINSRRTLIVLSPSFLESIWGRMEFKAAHAAAMKERRNRVILILKDDIPIDSLDDEWKIYIKTNTYIKWNDVWFWDKLKYALPHK